MLPPRFDDTLLRAMDRLIKMEKRGPKKKYLVAEKRLMYYSGWHKDDKPVTDEQNGEIQKKLM